MSTRESVTFFREIVTQSAHELSALFCFFLLTCDHQQLMVELSVKFNRPCARETRPLINLATRQLIMVEATKCTPLANQSIVRCSIFTFSCVTRDLHNKVSARRKQAG